MRTPLVAVLAVVVTLLLGGCGSDGAVRNYLDGAYQLQGESGETATYLASTPVGATAAAIAAAVRPAARQADGASEYLRYDDDIVIVGAAPNGSNIRVEDLDEGYRSGRYRHLGSGFDPGSPAGGATDGGPGEGK